VSGFEERARLDDKTFQIDDTVERLPYAEVDVTMLSVALSNLVENALKYSLKGTYIRISSQYDTQEAQIAVTDVGWKMPESAKENLSVPGKRWVVGAYARRIPGTGFGLWEASVIARAHGGEIDFTCDRYPRLRDAYRVSVWMTVPLKRTGPGPR
jgi:K+-sensing histidine kinase KdpD